MLVSVISALTSHALLLRFNGHYPGNADFIKHANWVINGSALKTKLVNCGIEFISRYWFSTCKICEKSHQDVHVSSTTVLNRENNEYYSLSF